VKSVRGEGERRKGAGRERGEWVWGRVDG